MSRDNMTPYTRSLFELGVALSYAAVGRFEPAEPINPPPRDPDQEGADDWAEEQDGLEPQGDKE